jgi:hypothetical protein
MVSDDLQRVWTALFGATGSAGDPFLALVTLLFDMGLLAASAGIIALGVVTIARGTLPWWCGVALIAGSPLSVLFGLAFIGLLGEVVMVPVGLGWVVVGYAVFRAAARLRERPARVR